MDNILNKLMEDMPSYDSSLARSMDSIQEVLHSVESQITELKGILDAGAGRISTGIRGACSLLAIQDIRQTG